MSGILGKALIVMVAVSGALFAWSARHRMPNLSLLGAAAAALALVLIFRNKWLLVAAVMLWAALIWQTRRAKKP